METVRRALRRCVGVYALGIRPTEMRAIGRKSTPQRNGEGERDFETMSCGSLMTMIRITKIERKRNRAMKEKTKKRKKKKEATKEKRAHWQANGALQSLAKLRKGWAWSKQQHKLVPSPPP